MCVGADFQRRHTSRRAPRGRACVTSIPHGLGVPLPPQAHPDPCPLASCPSVQARQEQRYSDRSQKALSHDCTTRQWNCSPNTTGVFQAPKSCEQNLIWKWLGPRVQKPAFSERLVKPLRNMLCICAPAIHLIVLCSYHSKHKIVMRLQVRQKSQSTSPYNANLNRKIRSASSWGEVRKGKQMLDTWNWKWRKSLRSLITDFNFRFLFLRHRDSSQVRSPYPIRRTYMALSPVVHLLTITPTKVTQAWRGRIPHLKSPTSLRSQRKCVQNKELTWIS